MLRSVYSGITGMRINQLWFDVIAGNMANVNTPGFKKSTISFEDLLNQTFSGAMQPTGELGGINPMQVGLGSKVSVIQVVHTQGTVKETQVATDLLIKGDGYFVVSDGGEINKYSRAGNFTFDNAGNLINLSNGFKILGWNADRDTTTGQLIIDANNKTRIDASGNLKGITISANDLMSPKATTKAIFEGNIDSSKETAFPRADDPNALKLNFVKYIESVVPVSTTGGLNLNSWDGAGFENTPTGTITIGPEGSTQTLPLGSNPQALINAINQTTATTGISIEYTFEDKFVLKTDPNNPEVKKSGGKIVISETPTPGRTGFFTEAKIPTKTYQTSVDLKFDFEHLLDPQDPDNYYLRWKAIDPSINNIASTNAYYYASDDYGVSSGQATGEELGYSTGAEPPVFADFNNPTLAELEALQRFARALVFELDSADVDPNSLQIFVEDPTTGERVIYDPYKLPASRGDITAASQPDYAPPANCYYFDDNGQTENIHPLISDTNNIGAWKTNIGKSKNGVDRIIFLQWTDATPAIHYGPPQAGSRITADYTRNGFNMSLSTVDPVTLEINIDNIIQDKKSYTFNNNLGSGGKDQVTFFSTVSTEDVVTNSLDTLKPFNKAGFNSSVGIVMWDDNTPACPMGSTITITWGGGSFTSGALRTYESVESFLKIVTEGVNALAETNLIDFTYDAVKDRFILKNTAGINISQSHEEGFLTHAKLPGEGSVLPASISANENPTSREEVVKNSLDITRIFPRVGFNNGFPDATSGTQTPTFLEFTWTDANGEAAIWQSTNLHTYNNNDLAVEGFISEINQAVSRRITDGVTNPDDYPSLGQPLGITLRYDPNTDRFTIINTNSSVRVRQSTSDGFLTKAKLLTTELSPVSIPTSPTTGGRITTANYNYNKTVEARGILQLDSNYTVINNFCDTESVPEITSSIEVIDGTGSVNLAGNWNQFDSGTLNGTITIETDSGTYTSNEINLTNYPTIQSLLNEINASYANVLIEYDPTMDKFTLKSRKEGARITLSETGTNPFFSEINLTLGKVEGGNNNSVMDLATERPTSADGWSDTTGSAGSGKDFFRINVSGNEVKGESLGTASSGKSGTQVIKHLLDADNNPETPQPAGDPLGINPLGDPDTATGLFAPIDLPHADVDGDSILVYYINNTDPTTIPMIVPNDQVEFSNNTGSGGVDQIIIRQVGTTPAANDYIYVDYTRRNAFDLKNPDVDPTTLVLKVNNIIQDPANYTFKDGEGVNGVDRIILDKSYGAGRVDIDYRQIAPFSSDVFIPNGNLGPEPIAFTPNTEVDTTYPGYKISNEGEDVDIGENTNYIINVSKKIYDSIGTAWDITYKFEKLSTNKWLWSVLNPSNNAKFGGYGIIAFDENGNYDKENSKLFVSPSDERSVEAQFKGLLFDPEGKDTGAPLLEIISDFAKLRQFSGTGVLANIASQDGYSTGKLVSKTINAQGIIVGTYSNDQIQNLGQIALATFVNPSGLLKESGTLFAETLNSGRSQIGKPGDAGTGVIQTGQLEMANVDLVSEFTDLIIAQRAFQANSRIIVTDDQILTEIVNMKR